MSQEPDHEYLRQYLRLVIIHSLDHNNLRNAEFAAERLLAMDQGDNDSLHLYCQTLFRQRRFMAVYNRTQNVRNHIGCAYLFAQLCLELEKYKEGIFVLLRVITISDDELSSPKNAQEPFSAFSARSHEPPASTADFSSPYRRYTYENSRSVTPDSSVVHHCLADLYSGLGDVKNAALHYTHTVRLNPFDFTAFEKVAKLGVKVRVGQLFKPEAAPTASVSAYSAPTTQPPGQPQTQNDPATPYPHNPFTTDLLTPRIRSAVPPDAPIRRPTERFEFTKPSFPDHRKGSAITSRLVSQPLHSDSRRSLKRNNSSSIANSSPEPTRLNIFASKEIEHCDKALLELYATFARAFKSLCKYDCYKAIRTIDELPAHEKETPWVLSKLGRLHYEIVNHRQSEHYFVQLRSIDRTRLEDMEYYLTLLWHLHKKVDLTYLADELHEVDAKSPITWCVVGNLFSLNRDTDDAISCFNKAIRADRKFTYAYTLKGHEYFGNDNYEMALENFRTSLLIDPRHYNALYGIGMVYINLGDFQRADYHFRKAVSINPINIILICCMGMVLEKVGKRHLALRQYELATKLQPNNPLPIFKKAQLLFTMQQYSQALAAFEILRDLAPDEASVRFVLGQLYNIQNEKAKAVREFTIALNLDPKGNYLIREAMELM